MKEFQDRSPSLFCPSIDRIGKQKMLITATNGDRSNPMTASWGALGVLWGLPVASVFVRPERYTHGLLVAGERFSLSFLPVGFKEALGICGRLSGRDGDKFAAAGLTRASVDGWIFPREAEEALLCRKLYAAPLSPDAICDGAPLAHYRSGGYHTVFIGEICRYLQRTPR